MRVPAEQFLTLRAFGAPPIVIALAAQGTFRGFMDTKTPLYAIGKYCSTVFLFLSLQSIRVHRDRKYIDGFSFIKNTR